MRAGRLILVVATLLAILVFPLAMRDALASLRLPNAYAAPAPVDSGGRVYQNGNNDDDDNDNRNNNNNNNNNSDDDEDNDNFECYANLNENEAVPCDDNGNANDNTSYSADNGNGNDNVPPPAPPASAPAASGGSVPSSRQCIAAGQSGDVSIVLSGGSVIVRVVPEAPFGQSAWIELDDVDAATVPAPPAGATVLDSLVWRMDGGMGCEGAAMGQLAGPVNLGIPYSVQANKSRLQVVHLRNGAWEDVPTVPDPDPAKPYISSTVRDTGIYAVIQRP